ncbi:hypothetical protein ACSNOI_25575 [Actinomadura kijaniata]|uniref:hypothetical protein n=1 Tax=Actinomadura kijaniata TaxID=46161 RepID=UPI003F1E276D
MRLMRAWLAAFGVVTVGLLVDSVAVLAFGRQVAAWPGFAATVLLVHVPWILTLLVAAAVSTRIYSVRRVSPRQLVAVFTVPVLFAVGSAVVGAATGDPVLGLVSAAEAVVGAVAGWFAMRRVTDPAQQGSGYFPTH